MIVNFCVGIENSKLSKIESAKQDCQEIFNSFKDVFSDDFDAVRSTILIDPDSFFVSKSIENAIRDLTCDDWFIFYFTGHGEVHEDSFLKLICSDTNSNNSISSSQLADSIGISDCHKIIILDCCYASAAFHIQQAGSYLNERKISIFAASLLSTEKGKDISPFTAQVCKALRESKEKGEAFGPSYLMTQVKRLYPPSQNNLAPQHIDASFNTPQTLKNISESFTLDFVRKILTSGYRTRETLWYSLLTLPKEYCLEIIKCWQEHAIASEPSWLVRRAIGTVLSELYSYSENIVDKIVFKLLKSSSWMDNTIGVIASRYMLNSVTKQRFLKKFIKSKNVDLAWLSFLYLTDKKIPCIQELKDSLLLKTSWGMIDCLCRLQHCEPSIINDFKILVTSLIKDDSTKYNGVETCINLYKMKNFNDLCQFCSYEDKTKIIESSSTWNFLKTSNPRGIITDSRLKWHLSAIYGSWRDQVSINIQKLIDSLEEEVFLEEMTKVGPLLPKVEMRMALVQRGALSLDRKKFKDCFLWCYEDPHPWVQREAICSLGFMDKTILDEITKKIIKNNNLYPGVLDLLLELPSSFVKQVLDEVTFLPLEKKALKWGIEQERNYVVN